MTAKSNLIAYACGMKGAGKSHLLARIAERFPRRLVLDSNAEFVGKIMGAAECMTLNETLDALEAVAEMSNWCVVACLSPKQTLKLLTAIAPADNPRGGFSLGVGGMLLECGEVDTIAPNRGMAPEAENIFARGRHYRLSIACGTRRPAEVNRLVTSQADLMAFFRQHEPSDVEYIGRFAGEAVAVRVGTLQQFHHVRYFPQLGRVSVVDQDGAETEIASVFQSAPLGSDN